MPTSENSSEKADVEASKKDPSQDKSKSDSENEITIEDSNEVSYNNSENSEKDKSKSDSENEVTIEDSNEASNNKSENKIYKKSSKNFEENRVYQCPYCDIKIPLYNNLKTHVKKSHPNEKIGHKKDFQCPYCGKKIALAHNLTIHVTKCTTKEKIGKKSSQQQAPPKKCQYCDENFSENFMPNHVKLCQVYSKFISKMENSYKCKLCMYQSSFKVEEWTRKASISYLYSHIQNYHKKELNPDQNETNDTG